MRIAELPWLPAPPEDLKARIADLASATEPGSAIHSLATHALDPRDLRRLGKEVARFIADGADLAPLSAFKLAILSDRTFDFVAETLPASAARHGVALTLRTAPAGLVEGELADERSATQSFAPDGIMLALGANWFGLDKAYLEDNAATAAIEDALERLDGLAAQLRATPIFCTLPAPAETLFGNYERSVAGSQLSLVNRFNEGLPKLVSKHGGLVFNLAHVAAQFGLAGWHDARAMALYKLPFAPAAVPLVADRLGALLGAVRGKARKCLVLDLDNTCWGGAIGDDGLESIVLGQGDPLGEAFQAVQRAALDLKARGIVLAVCSKNDDANARLPFREHPDMLLRESDIAVFQANWQDKPSNLEAIAGALDIGLDALVMLDDNSAERAAIRAALPMVAVPELPADPTEFVAHLLAAGYFETSGFTAEDRERAESYRANADRVAVRESSRDLGDYLSALEMRISHKPFDAIGRARIAQLVGKSNQFNLTTRRYTEGQISEFEADPAIFTQQTRLSDRYGDFGMIGVIIARPSSSKSWDIDTWLMSCRVLGRRVEEAMLADLVHHARAAGMGQLTATYIPTAKNTMVAEHFDKLGFALLGEDGDGVRKYTLSLSDYSAPDVPFGED